MADMSTYLRNALRDHVFRTASFSKLTTLYVSLHTADPGRTGANEVSGGGYARVGVSVGDAYWNAPEDGAATNASTISFPNPTADWGTITHAGLWTAPTGGNFLARAALLASVTIFAGDPTPVFGPGRLKFVFS